MLAIRMQRTGRKGHAEFRIVVQDSRRTPTSGAIVAQLGHYSPHAKTTSIDKEKAGFYLDHGAQPSNRVARLLQKEGVKLPDWVKLATDKSRATRHPVKLRKNQPTTPVVSEEPDETVAESAEDKASEPVSEDSAGNSPAETVAEEEPAAKETEK